MKDRSMEKRKTAKEPPDVMGPLLITLMILVLIVLTLPK
jgi:hypothetical protein